MSTIWKVISGTGFVLVILGIACADSPSILIPVAMIASGAVMVGASAGAESRWTGRRST